MPNWEIYAGYANTAGSTVNQKTCANREVSEDMKRQRQSTFLVLFLTSMFALIAVVGLASWVIILFFAS